MHLHSSSFDVEKFTAEHVPLTHLPSDFGGSGESVDVLHVKLCEDFLEMREWLEAEERQAAQEFDWRLFRGVNQHLPFNFFSRI